MHSATILSIKVYNMKGQQTNINLPAKTPVLINRNFDVSTTVITSLTQSMKQPSEKMNLQFRHIDVCQYYK